MTDLRKKTDDKNIFQNLKMVDKILKATLKLLTETNTNQDILEKIFDIKKEVIDLENIATELSKSKENDTESKRFEHNEDTETQIENNPAIVKCDPCKRKFPNISSLEKHIKKNHTEYDTHECEQCKKKFVTIWRLKKHTKMHSGFRIVQCRYYRNNLRCPFEELGCKFLHDSDIQENYTTSDTSVITPGSRSTVMSGSEKSDNFDSFENLAFCTSTPKKPGQTKNPGQTKKPGQTKSYESKRMKLQCENCTDQSQCDGCYVDEYIQRQ
jgi:hypothetical protein